MNSVQPLGKEQQRFAQGGHIRAGVPQLQRAGGRQDDRRTGHRPAGGGALGVVVDALPGERPHHAIGSQARVLLPRHHSLPGGGAELAVHRDGGDVGIVGGQLPQIILQRPHRRATAALPQRAGKLSGGHIVIHQLVGHRQKDLVEFVPCCAAHHAVRGQTEFGLEGCHRAGGGRAVGAVHCHGGQAAVIACRHAQPELYQPHIDAPAALPQRRARPGGAAGIALGADPGRIQRVPGGLPHDAVHRQPLLALERPDGVLGGGAEVPVHRHAGNGGAELRQPGQPELHHLHIRAGGAAPQHRAGPCPAALRAGEGLALAGQLGQVLHTHIDIGNFIPCGAAHHTVHRQAELFLEGPDAALGGGVKGAGDVRFAKAGIVLGDAGQLLLQRVHRRAGGAAPQRAAGVAFRDGGNVVGGDQLHPAAVVVPQNLQGIHALVGPVHGAPLFHAGAGHRLAVAVFGEIRLRVTGAAHIGGKQLSGDALHHGEHGAPAGVDLVIAGAAADVEAVPAAGVPLGPHPVERQRDLRQNVGTDGLFRPPVVSMKTGFFLPFFNDISFTSKMFEHRNSHNFPISPEIGGVVFI